MHNFRKLEIWKDAMLLTTAVYKLTKDFPEEERYGLISQIRKSAVSIPSNIAEGAGRNTNGEFKQFLSIANASAFELETQLLIAINLAFITESSISPLIEQIHSICKRIYVFKNTLT